MSKLLRKSNKGFTLIELMIVVAIIGILAAIAIPNFLRFQLKSKSSEGKVNIAAIRTAEEAYMAEFGSYVSAINTPPTIPGVTKADFTNGGYATFNDTLGWLPEGQVYFVYGVTAAANSLDYTVDAAANIDGDTANQTWAYSKVTTAIQTGPNGCQGVEVGTATNVAGVVGPCQLANGQSIF